MRDLSRRGFLAAGAVLAASMAVPTAARASDASWRQLGRQLHGRLVLPGDPAYPALAQPRNLRFAALMPQAVALCRDAEDIATAVAWARETGTPFAIRGGGHNYASASSSKGLIISTRRMRRLSMKGATLRAQAGVLNADIARLLPQGGAGTLLLPGGNCPNVGIAGLTLGGGIGPNATWAGLSADRLRKVSMVTADGGIVTADANRNPDLFWALRGSAGGNFGIVTDLAYELVEVPVARATTIDIAYPIASATPTAMAWQEIRHGDQRLLGGSWTMSTSDAGSGVRVRAQVLLAEADARAFMAPLLAIPATKSEIVERSWWDAYAWYVTPSTPPNTFWPRSLYLDADLADSVIDQAAALLERFPRGASGNASIRISGWVGGRVNDIGAADTAYVHRGASALLDISAGWPDPTKPRRAPAPAPPAIADWMDAVWETFIPHSTGRSYQNFPDPGLRAPLHAYYGANLGRLIRVKRRWDPDEVFTYAQGIPADT